MEVARIPWLLLMVLAVASGEAVEVTAISSLVLVQSVVASGASEVVMNASSLVLAVLIAGVGALLPDAKAALSSEEVMDIDTSELLVGV